jgi:hypothetical protein
LPAAAAADRLRPLALKFSIQSMAIGSGTRYIEGYFAEALCRTHTQSNVNRVLHTNFLDS